MPVLELLLRGENEIRRFDCISYGDHPLGAPFYVLRLRGGGEVRFQASEVVMFKRLPKVAVEKSNDCGFGAHSSCEVGGCGCECHAGT
jgi:hypothetical protein